MRIWGLLLLFFVGFPSSHAIENFSGAKAVDCNQALSQGRWSLGDPDVDKFSYGYLEFLKINRPDSLARKPAPQRRMLALLAQQEHDKILADYEEAKANSARRAELPLLFSKLRKAEGLLNFAKSHDPTEQELRDWEMEERQVRNLPPSESEIERVRREFKELGLALEKAKLEFGEDSLFYGTAKSRRDLMRQRLLQLEREEDWDDVPYWRR